MGSSGGGCHLDEIIARVPGDIQIVVYGESFPAKRLKSISSISNAESEASNLSDFAGCVELGEWLTDDQRCELQRLVSFQVEHSATVFQILVNVPPMRRLICEWPHDRQNQDGCYYFMQLVDLDA